MSWDDGTTERSSIVFTLGFNENKNPTKYIEGKVKYIFFGKLSFACWKIKECSHESRVHIQFPSLRATLLTAG